jgi:potassium uptake protein, trkH family
MIRAIGKKIRALKPVQILTLGFLLVVLTGAGLLMIPSATVKEGTDITFMDALFTATSAVCVTGLTVVNTGLVFTLFGKIVVLCLIQIGGLGFMTMASLIFMAVGKRISLRERLILQESFNSDSLQGMVKLVRRAVLVTFTVEGAAAFILCLRLMPEYGFADGLFHSIFLSISAFCNAGFDAFGFPNSIEPYIADPVINFTIMALITVGGLGFSVVLDVIHRPAHGRLLMHTRIVLMMSGALFLSGALLIAVLEWNNPATLGRPDLNPAEKIMAACFQSVTLRTAGFDTIGQGDLTPAGQLVSIIYMFIGASPASTGGGLKTTTFFVILVSVVTIIRQRPDYNYRRRRFGEPLVKKALAIFVLALFLVIGDTVILSALEYWNGGDETMVELLFEVVSAFGTVGLTTGITPELHDISKFLLIVTMFCGRVGLLTITMALSGGSKKDAAVHYPEERVMIG